VNRSTSETAEVGRRGQGSGVALALGLILVIGAPSRLAWAEGEEAGQSTTAPPPSNAPPPSTAPPPSNVDIDRLLRLPSSYSETSSRRGGSAADDWRERFREARADLDNAKVALVKAQRELENTASATGQWAVSAPGASDPQNSPVSYKLRQEIRDQRENVEKYERDLRVLEIEADLKEVPLDWRD